MARTGKMTDAADELFISQSAISLQIKALEEEMDVVLFERRGPRIQLTPDGRKLLDMARPLVEGMDGLAERFDKEVRGNLESGKIVIAAGESTNMYILPSLVSNFHKHYPKIRVELRNVTGRDGLAMIRGDEVDFGISITTGICLRKKDPLVVRNMSRYFPKRSYGIVERRGKHLSLAARAFLDGINDDSMPDLPYMHGA